MSDARSARKDFRVQTRTRGGYDGATMYDVQLLLAETGAMVWAQTFTDQTQSDDFQTQLEDDLDELTSDEFRRKYSVPSTA